MGTRMYILGSVEAKAAVLNSSVDCDVQVRAEDFGVYEDLKEDLRAAFAKTAYDPEIQGELPEFQAWDAIRECMPAVHAADGFETYGLGKLTNRAFDLATAAGLDTVCGGTEDMVLAARLLAAQDCVIPVLLCGYFWTDEMFAAKLAAIGVTGVWWS